MICLQIGKPTILTQSDQSIKAFNPVSGVRDGFLESYELNKLPLGFLAVFFLNPGEILESSLYLPPIL